MGSMKSFILGLSIGLVTMACAGIVFPYKFYHISGNNYAGTLLGATQADDVPFSQCRPVNGKQQCVVVFYPELNRVIVDYKQCKSDLIDCQRGR